LALVASGAAQQATSLLLGSASWPGEGQIALWAGLGASAFTYALVVHYSTEGRSSRSANVVHIAIGAGFLWQASGIAAGVLTGAYHLVGAGASHAYSATLRTGVLAGLSLLLAWVGSRWKRRELSHLIYPAMFLGGYRLVAQDLQQGHTGALFLSLLLYGAVLITLPRLKEAQGARVTTDRF
jgi:hypothetical protein